jgi:alkylation response protein AidB-like acyl-CoA dehydrogenase
MDFTVPAETQALVKRMRDFLGAEVVPVEKDMAERGFFAVEPKLDELRGRVKALGMWAPQVPKDVGGMGLPLMEHALVSEALGRSPLGHYVFGAQAPDAGNIEVLHKFGTDEQKQRWLVPLAAGKIRSCFSMTEPGSPGSNPTQLECLAQREGESWVIDGRKWFTSSADGAAFAIVMAVTDPGAPPHRRASMIIVPTDTPGFRRVRNISIMGHAGEGYPSHSEIAYERCRVPLGNLLGEQGAGFTIAQERLGPGRIHHCMRWLGICDRAFELMCKRAASRRIDAEETLAQKGIIQTWIAESRAHIAAARLFVLDTAWKIDQHGFRAAQEEVSLIKFHVAGVLQGVLDKAIQVHGALGITDDTPLAGWWAHERGARIYDGPDEVHKISAAKRIVRRVVES